MSRYAPDASRPGGPRIWGRMRRHLVRHADLLLFAALAVACLPVLWALLAGGWPATADGELHLMRVALFHEQVQQGAWLARWTPQLYLGYGYPLFNFYAPAIYVAAEFLHRAGLNEAQAVGGVMVLAVVLAGWGAYLLARDTLGGRLAGVVAGVAYATAPYLLTNLYIRGAVAELAAQALLPWIFWSFHRLLADSPPRPGIQAIAVGSLALLAFTHNITLLFTPPVLLLYVALWAWRTARKGRPWRAGVARALPAAGAAAGVSALFWLPLMAERGLLSPAAYTVDHLPDHVWAWSTFLDPSLRYGYSADHPFPLGMVQLVLGAAGLLLLRRRAVAWGWAALALLAGLGMGAAALPLWRNVELLQIAQFPWRLLTWVNLALALLAGGAAAALESWSANSATGRIRQMTVAAVALLPAALLLVAHTPPPDLADMTPYADVQLNREVMARFEMDRPALGASWTDEFLPRGASLPAAGQAGNSTNDVALRVLAAGPDQVQLAVQTPRPFTLTLQHFYFPGHTATLDGRPADLTPSPEHGLARLAIPAGDHRVTLAHRETPVQQLAGWISLAALVGLALCWGRRGRARMWAAAPGALALAGLWLMLQPASVALPLQAPPVAPVHPDLALVGVDVEQIAPTQLLITPYWFVEAPLPALTFRWQLASVNDDAPRTELEAMPYFGAWRSDRWSPGSLVRDGQLLWLPPGLPAGEHQLLLAVGPADPAPVATVTVAPGAPPAQRVTLARFTMPGTADQAWLDVDATLMERPLPTVRPGDMLRYTLYWRGRIPSGQDYHSFVHLLDGARAWTAGSDQLPGTVLNSPRLWNPLQGQRDSHRLRIPPDAPSGLYTPHVGLYRFGDGVRLEATVMALAGAGDDGVDLPPVKVVQRRWPDDLPAGVQLPGRSTVARFGDFARLQGYNLETPPAGVTAGSTLTLTLFYRGQGAAPVDYTQFVHLYCVSPCAGGEPAAMAAQMDAPPGRGANPTTTWTRDEAVVERLPLVVRTDAVAGRYQLRLGFYDPADPAVRAPVLDRRGQPLADNQLLLTELTIQE